MTPTTLRGLVLDGLLVLALFGCVTADAALLPQTPTQTQTKRGF